jgi:hypothetical protein
LPQGGWLPSRRETSNRYSVPNEDGCDSKRVMSQRLDIHAKETL